MKYINEINKRLLIETGEEQLILLTLLQNYIKIRNDIAKLLGRVLIP
mgnify:CR=1 FL=1